MAAFFKKPHTICLTPLAKTDKRKTWNSRPPSFYKHELHHSEINFPESGVKIMNPTSRSRRLVIAVTLALVTVLSLEGFPTVAHAKKKKKNARGTSVLWRDPGNIRQRNLYYGPGSTELAPKPPFRFLKEDLEGGMPKFDVRDANDVKWRVKLGPEAQAMRDAYLRAQQGGQR